MFLKTLIISSFGEIIRNIEFHMGLNLIVDETPSDDSKSTGNNVGKTTVLKLIDVCLGAKPAIVYSDTESKKDTYAVVKDFLVDNEVIVTLVLKEDLNKKDSKEIKIERNFLQRNKLIRRIDGKQLTEDEFFNELMELLFPHHKHSKPTFRQIISHNIRYSDHSINNTTKTLDRYTTDAEYETLYLFLLGCDFEGGEDKQLLLHKLKQEETYKNRLEKFQTKNAYEAALSLIDSEINDLNDAKKKFNINENYERDFEELNNIKYRINRTSSVLGNHKIRKELIIETIEELDTDVSKIDVQQLKFIYDQATDLIGPIQRSFEELLTYHNKMIFEKKKFVTKELPDLQLKIDQETKKMQDLLTKEQKLTEVVAKSDSFLELEKLLNELNEMYRRKGEYESIISQIEEVESNIENYNTRLKSLDGMIFSQDFEKFVKNQMNKFNKFFAAISNELYGEKYALKHDIVNNKNNQPLYKFTAFNANLSSGKKQGEILCFDLAYIMFADSESIPTLHFLLNDKKELMHDNQLLNVSKYIEDKNMQMVTSILKDKLPPALKDERYFVVQLSQSEKLFKIEKEKK